ncbi:MAG: hypothetical protein NZ518_07940 [Dehalococcoidia bacterium]|nr:hypothetical protein [Dehalococcoidia bacterium]
MRIVAGVSLRNLHPRVWDRASPYYLPQLSAVMISYADLARAPRHRAAAMARGLRGWLGIPDHVQVYLDNGAFAFARRRDPPAVEAYVEFVARAAPDWCPAPWDRIPLPAMDDATRRACVEETLQMNRRFGGARFAPVAHCGGALAIYLAAFAEAPWVKAATSVALGGIVPNLLRAPKAIPYAEVIDGLARARRALPDKQLHVFGIGGAATLHLAAILGIDSVDSTGWRNRAARGIVQLPGRGDRQVAQLGSWSGRAPSDDEWRDLARCACPPCQRDGVNGLRRTGLAGFCHRATHNLFVLLEEDRAIADHLAAGDYPQWSAKHLVNSTYAPLVREAWRRVRTEAAAR